MSLCPPISNGLAVGLAIQVLSAFLCQSLQLIVFGGMDFVLVGGLAAVVGLVVVVDAVPAWATIQPQRKTVVCTATVANLNIGNEPLTSKFPLSIPFTEVRPLSITLTDTAGCPQLIADLPSVSQGERNVKSGARSSIEHRAQIRVQEFAARIEAAS